MSREQNSSSIVVFLFPSSFFIPLSPPFLLLSFREWWGGMLDAMSSRKLKERRKSIQIIRLLKYNSSYLICSHMKGPVTRNNVPPCDFVHKRIIIIARLVVCPFLAH